MVIDFLPARIPPKAQADQCSAAIAKGDYAGAIVPCNNVMSVITAAAGDTLDMCVRASVGREGQRTHIIAVDCEMFLHVCCFYQSVLVRLM